MLSINNQKKKAHHLCRDYVCNDLLKLYSVEREIAMQYPLKIEFKDEIAFDAGGVSRDAFSPFLTKHMNIFLMAPCSLPHSLCCLNAHISILGTVISHAYLSAGVFPTRIAFPCLAAALLGSNVYIPDSIMLEYFLGSLSTYVLQNAARDFHK